jgi:hypothetical protein
VLLSGSASMMPAVGAMLQARCGVTPTPVRPPKGAVALGALAALAARREPRRAAAAPAGEPSARRRAAVTALVQHEEWDDVAAPVQAWLIEAVLTAGEDEEFVALLPDALIAPGNLGWDAVDERRDELADCAVVLTSRRALAAAAPADGAVTGLQVALAEVVTAGPATAAAAGLYGVRLALRDAAHTVVPFGATAEEILALLAEVSARLAAAPTPAAERILANLRGLMALRAYERAPAGACEAALHAVATATEPEEIESAELCNTHRVLFVTTTDRLLWAGGRNAERGVGQARYTQITSVHGLSTVKTGPYAVRIVVGEESNDFELARPEKTVALVVRRQGGTPRPWLDNLARLRASPGWRALDLEARHWLEHALVGVGEDEELLEFVHCAYESGSSAWGADSSRTTGLVLTSRRVLWARVGIFTGLTTGQSTIARIKKVSRRTIQGGVWLTIGDKKHGFTSFAEESLYRRLVALRGA